jgi:hypothetical protein
MPTTAEALAVVLLSIVPGYLARTAWARGKTFRLPTSDLTVIVQSIAASLVIQIVLSPLTITWILSVDNELGSHPWRVAGWAVAMLIVSVAGGFLFGVISNSFVFIRPLWLRRALTPALPTMWDIAHIEGKIPKLSLLVVEYSDGRRVAGAFAGKSAATTSPERHGLYLEEEWDVGADGVPTTPVANTGGVVMAEMADVRCVHVFLPPELPLPSADMIQT